MKLLDGLKEEIRTHIENGDIEELSEQDINDIVSAITNDNEFNEVLWICIKYYSQKQRKGELNNDGMGNHKRV